MLDQNKRGAFLPSFIMLWIVGSSLQDFGVSSVER